MDGITQRVVPGRACARHTARFFCLALLPLWVGAVATPARAVTDLKRGDVAPPIVAQTTDGTAIDTTKTDGHVLLLLFGDTGQDKTRQACRQITSILEGSNPARSSVRWILVLSKGSDVDDLSVLQRGKAERRVIHDTTREIFNAYKIIALPSVVVVDGSGKVVHAIAGLSNRFSDIVSDALLLATGRISVEDFERSIHPKANGHPDPAHVRADRIVHLARQLGRRGMHRLAEAKYREALELLPDSASAKIGLGELYLAQDRPDEAEPLFREVLAVQPDSSEAALGLVAVHVGRGSEALEEGEQLLEQVLEHHPSSARAHYLMGMIHEQREEIEKAAAHFKAAAELLLDRLEADGFVEEPKAAAPEKS